MARGAAETYENFSPRSGHSIFRSPVLPPPSGPTSRSLSVVSRSLSVQPAVLSLQATPFHRQEWITLDASFIRFLAITGSPSYRCNVL